MLTNLVTTLFLSLSHLPGDAVTQWLVMKRLASVAIVVGGAIAVGAARAQVFSEVTVAAGISYNQYANYAGFDPRIMSGGAAAGDYDNDGWVDLFVTRADDTNILYRNQGNGTFAPVAPTTSGIDFASNSNGATWGDIDNDGDLDLYVTTIGIGRNLLYLNNGNGTFSEAAGANGAAAQNSGSGIDGRFSATFGDYDGDGYLDLYTTSWADLGGVGNRLFRNQGAANPGQFTDVTVAAGVTMDQISNTLEEEDAGNSFGFSPRFADLDGDGRLDLTVAGDFGTSRLFWNNGDGTFTDGTLAAGVGTDENGMGSTIADYDRDGRLDWFVTSIYAEPGSAEDPSGNPDANWGISGNRLYRNNGDRTFSDATDSAGVRDGGWGWGTTFFDYDNDGDQDLVMTNGYEVNFTTAEDGFNNDPMRLWRNDGAGVFTEVATLEGISDNGSGKGLLTLDYDNDGDLDLLVVNNQGEPVLYRNDSTGNNDWIAIGLAGSESNRYGIGALITVLPELGGPEQIFEVNTGSNYLGQNDILAHFGLGQLSGNIDKITVVWPSGIIHTLTNVQANRRVLLDESTGILVTVPEPSTLILSLVSLAGLVCAARRQDGVRRR